MCFSENSRPCSLSCLQQLMISLQMSGLQRVQFCCCKWETDKKQWRVTNSFCNKTWQGAYYWRQLQASRGHSIDAGANFNDPRIHLPFSFSLLSPSNENIEKVIVTIKLQQSSLIKNKVWLNLTWKIVHYTFLQRENRTETEGIACFVWFAWCQAVHAPAQNG